MKPETYKLFGPISICITGIAIVVMLVLSRKDKSMSISQHAAANRSSYTMMLIVQTITLPMIFIFFAKALTPIAELPNLFVVFVGAICAGLLFAAWVPDKKGLKGTLHQLAAYGAAALVVPAQTMIYLSNHISVVAKYIALTLLIYDIAVLTLFAASNKKAHDSHLYLQATYIFLFAFSTLAAVYIR